MAIDRAPVLRSSRAADDLTLLDLLDVLDRADDRPLRARPRPARSTGQRHGQARSVRPLPLARPVPVPRPRPAAAPVPAVALERVAPAGTRPALRAGVRRVVRRLASWDAGPDGAYLAWGRPVAPSAAPGPSARSAVRVPATWPERVAPAERRPALLARVRGVVRRLALWGAGPDGAHLAWGHPVAPAPRADGPVLLTELPSTPTYQPAAPSPAAALVPARTARPVAPPRVPVVPPLARQVPAPRPTPSPGTASAGHRPRSARATGPARARGDPRPPPARGQPPG
ncbi:hypothetical protein [Geodermatophilus sabuli]|uniref:Uncharacterized protein n=1 Tax=Geodermatophilus sabuli TaxID=1564158 RepID=A0A285EHD5_9ACTN|nr:hypothetical protein [Geodermatophilus sabuli]MBB3086354.1 hypothetical protein [Geodermatophilus sabuli]SNX97431.1 hypothetical protein SAMN06893097_10772 [Geodermatophilus sabuli]